MNTFTTTSSRGEVPNAPAHPLVSVVITTRNEGKNIRDCLESIKAQSWPNIETIVVDNNSTDRTQAIAAEYTPKVYTKGPERSAQRNYGMIDQAKGEYVIYVDADMILAPTLIEACIHHIRKMDAIALHIPEIVLGKNYFSRVRRFERSFYDGTPVDGARFFHRRTFVKVGGFDENPDLITAEDYNLWLKLSKNNFCFHFVKDILDFMTERASKYGYKTLYL